MVLGILGSGSGSNMQAILDAIDAGTLDATICLVLSDHEGAYILERAAKHGIPNGVIDCMFEPGHLQGLDELVDR